MRRWVLTAAVSLVALVVAETGSAWTWPVSGDVLRPFVLGSDPYAAGQHRGADIGAGSGEPVRAPAAGTVSFAGTVPGSGRTVTIQTADGYAVTLTHLGSVDVAQDDVVEEGAMIGLAGSSGEVEHSSTYVHLGIRTAAMAEGYLDPLAFLPPRVPQAPTPSAEPEPRPVPVEPAVADTPAPAPPPQPGTPTEPVSGELAPASSAPAAGAPATTVAPTPVANPVAEPAPAPGPVQAPAPRPVPVDREVTPSRLPAPVVPESFHSARTSAQERSITTRAIPNVPGREPARGEPLVAAEATTPAPAGTGRSHIESRRPIPASAPPATPRELDSTPQTQRDPQPLLPRAEVVPHAGAVTAVVESKPHASRPDASRSSEPPSPRPPRADAAVLPPQPSLAVHESPLVAASVAASGLVAGAIRTPPPLPVTVLRRTDVGTAPTGRSERADHTTTGSIPAPVAVRPEPTPRGRDASSGLSHARLLPAALGAAAVVIAIVALLWRGRRGKLTPLEGLGGPVRMMDARGVPEEDPGRSGVALRERPATYRPCRGIRCPGGHLRPLPPAVRQRRADGLRDGRARDSDHGGRGPRRRPPAQARR